MNTEKPIEYNCVNIFCCMNSSESKMDNYTDHSDEISSTAFAKPEDFEFIKIVGQGNFGKVYLVTHIIDNKQYALKILDKNEIFHKGEERHVMNERDILIENQKHPFVTSLYYSFQTKNELFLAMEYISGGELFYYIQHQRSNIEKNAAFYAAEIAIAVGYLHSKNIIYRDLKPENILLDSDGHIVITDFGLCTQHVSIAEGRTHSFCGTREYLAPEVISKKKYDKSVDWWGLGAVLYEIFCGIPPFYTTNIKKLYTSIVKKPLKIRADLSDNAKNILMKLLEKNPKYRLGSSKRDVMDIQDHEFFNSVNWDDLKNKRIIPPFQPTSTIMNEQYDTRFPTKQVFKNESLTSSITDNNNIKIISGFSYTAPGQML
ncbi:hypothetical protein PGB90_009082 [Kerria lacca]